MIRWCRKCDTQPLDSYDQIFGNGACVFCISEGVGKAFDNAVLFGQEQSLTEKIRAARERRTPYSITEFCDAVAPEPINWCSPDCLCRKKDGAYTTPYVDPNTLVGVEIDGKIYTDTLENLQKPKKVFSLGDWWGEFLESLFPTQSEDHIIRSEN